METTPEIKPKLPSLKEAYNKALGETFATYLKPLVTAPQPKMVSVGCGMGFDSDPLITTFPNGSYLGIDIDKSALRFAQRVYQDPRIRFEMADVTKVDTLGENNWDLVIVRHPQVLREEPWGTILKNAWLSLKPDGTFFATTDTPEEEAKILEMLGPDFNLLKKEINTSPSVGGTHGDWGVIIGKK